MTSLNIPDFKIEASGEVSAAKVVLKVGTSAAKCYIKAFGTAFKFGGTIPSDILTKINACLASTRPLRVAERGVPRLSPT